MKKVLMIAYEFPPTNASGSMRAHHFARYLKEYGYWPIVITQSGFGQYETDEGLLRELVGCCETHVVRRPGHLAGLGKTGRILEWTAVAVAAGIRKAARPGYELIWVTAPPWFCVWGGFVLQRVLAKPLVLDMRDPWTYGLLWRADTPARVFLERWSERSVMAAATRVVYTSPLTSAVMRRRMGPQIGRRIVTIPNGFAPDAVEAVRDAPRNRCVFRYVGRLEAGFRDPDILLKALALACSQEPAFGDDVLLQFVGDLGGPDSRVTGWGLGDRVQCLGFRAADESRGLMRGADVLVLLQSISGLGDDVISGKAYEYLAARRPILGVVSRTGGDAWLIKQTQCGTVTGIEDTQQVAEGFLHFWRLWKQGDLDGLAAEADIKRYDRRNLTGELARLFDVVLGERTARCGL